MIWREVNGASIRYQLIGSGPLVVFIHEMGGSLESWDAVIPLLTDFQILRYDQRGSGLSEKVKGRLDIDTLANDLAGLLKSLQLTSKPAVVGNAVGVGVALHFAACFPDLVSAVIGFSPVTECVADRRQAILATVDAIEANGMRAFVDASIKINYPEQIRTNAENFSTIRGLNLANDPSSFAAILRMYSDMNIDSDLETVACPCLMVGATLDTARPPAAVKAVARAIADSEYREIPSGHYAAAQTPNLVAQEIRGFLSSIGITQAEGVKP